MQSVLVRFWRFFMASGGYFTWSGIAVGVGLLGVGTSLVGANKQAGAIDSANQANQQAQQQQNNLQWQAWLMSKGIQPTNPVTAGTMPTSFTAINTRLPLWANVNVSRALPSSTGRAPIAPPAPAPTRTGGTPFIIKAPAPA